MLNNGAKQNALITIECEDIRPCDRWLLTQLINDAIIQVSENTDTIYDVTVFTSDCAHLKESGV